jgi:hypothetical protein
MMPSPCSVDRVRLAKLQEFFNLAVLYSPLPVWPGRIQPSDIQEIWIGLSLKEFVAGKVWKIAHDWIILSVFRSRRHVSLIS